MIDARNIKAVGDLCEFRNGRGFSAKEWAKEGWPIIRIQNLNGSREFNYFNGPTQESWFVENGDLLFAWAGTRGVSFGPTIWDGPKGVLNQHIFKVIPRPGVDKRWLLDALEVVTARIERKAHGFKSTLLHVQKSDITEQTIYTPSFSDQKDIGEKLAIWTNAISLAGSLIAAKQEQRKGLMQQLLSGKRRFPGFTKPWQEARLGEVFSNRTEAGRTELPLVSITGNEGVVFRDGLDRKDTSSADKSKYLRICPGDIGYNTMRMWQGVSGLSQIEGIVSPAYTIVTPDDSLHPEFMALLFKYPPVVHLFYRYSQGLVSDTWNLKFRHFSEIRVRLPEKKEQEAIAAVFRPVDKELSLLRQQLDAFKEQKKGLMQQLLTGKVRVKPAKEAVA